MWPCKERPYMGIFVHEQVNELVSQKSIHSKVIVIKGYLCSLNYIKSIFSINNHLFQNKYDIIHIHFGLSGLFLLLRFRKNNKVVLTLHGSDINIESSNFLKVFITKLILRFVDKIICVNEKMISKTNQKDKCVIIPCGVNLNIFYPTKKDKNREIIQIVFPSSPLRVEKNFPLFESIIERLRDNFPHDIKVVIIDKLTRFEVAEILRNSDLLLLTSISEGSPQIVKEAMACNLPIVSTNVGDVSILLSELPFCEVINSFNADDFINPILNILNRKTELNEHIFLNRLKKLQLDSNSISEKLMKVYDSLLNKND